MLNGSILSGGLISKLRHIWEVNLEVADGKG